VCLTIVSKRHRRPYKGEGVGYKVFDADNGRLHFMYYPLKGIDPFKPTKQKELVAPRGRWLRSVEGPVYMDNGEVYKSGFHVYTGDYAKAIINVDGDGAVKVKYRGVKAVGEQNGHRTIVVDEIFIPRGRKRVPSQS
jgi:hypothetical protein